jgi:selenocysteine lyase/cysteine desulfurase
MSDDFRARFPILQSRVYLNSCSQGALSIEAAAALDRFRASWDDRGSAWEEWMAEVERLRALVARLLGADEDEIAVMPNASTALAAIATAIDFSQERNEVALGELEFPTSAHGWLAQERRGARIVWARSHGSALPIAAYESIVSDRTRVVAATSVGFRTGFRTDLSGVVDLARRCGAWSFVDDYQRTGTGPLDVHALGVDVLITGSLKYLLGASGVAFLYVRRGLIESLEPLVTGWFGRREPFAFRADRLDWSSSARRFETGSPPVPSVYAACAGIELVQREGLQSIETRIGQLSERLMTSLARRGYSAITLSDPSMRGPLVVVRSTDAETVAQRLAARRIVVSARGDGVRCSFHAYNNEADVDCLIDALDAEQGLIVRV